MANLTFDITNAQVGDILPMFPPFLRVGPYLPSTIRLYSLGRNQNIPVGLRNTWELHALIGVLYEGLFERAIVPCAIEDELSVGDALATGNWRVYNDRQTGLVSFLDNQLPAEFRTQSLRSTFFDSPYASARVGTSSGQDLTDILWRNPSCMMVLQQLVFHLAGRYASSRTRTSGGTSFTINTFRLESSFLDALEDAEEWSDEFSWGSANGGIAWLLGQMQKIGPNLLGSSGLLVTADAMWDASALVSKASWASLDFVPRTGRLILDYLWAMQATLGYMTFNYAQPGVDWRFWHETRTVEYEATIDLDGNVSSFSTKSDTDWVSESSAMPNHRIVEFSRSASGSVLGAWSEDSGGGSAAVRWTLPYADVKGDLAFDYGEMDGDAYWAAYDYGRTEPGTVANLFDGIKNLAISWIGAQFGSAVNTFTLRSSTGDAPQGTVTLVASCALADGRSGYCRMTAKPSGNSLVFYATIGLVTDTLHSGLDNPASVTTLRDYANRYLAGLPLIDALDKTQTFNLSPAYGYTWTLTFPDGDPRSSVSPSADHSHDVITLEVACTATRPHAATNVGMGIAHCAWPCAWAYVTGDRVAKETLAVAEKMQIGSSSSYRIASRTVTSGFGMLDSSSTFGATLLYGIADEMVREVMAALGLRSVSEWTPPTPSVASSSPAVNPQISVAVLAAINAALEASHPPYSEAVCYYNPFRSEQVNSSGTFPGYLYPYKIAIDGDIVWQSGGTELEHFGEAGWNGLHAHSQSATVAEVSDSGTLTPSDSVVWGVKWKWKSLPCTSAI